MHLIFRDPARGGVEAILLAASEEHMRVIIRQQEDTIEFRLVGDQWISDDGTVIEIEALFSDGPDAVTRVWSTNRLHACAVGV